MLKGLLFFIKHSWKYDRLYIIWRVAYQFVNSLIPIIATLLPKYIIDELMGQKRPETLMLYVGVLAGYTLLATGLSVFWGMDGFTRRCGVNAEFDSRLHQLLYEADFANIENPEFLDMQEKAKKFLYCDWHGFGYLLDCALNIVGQLFTLAGVAAVIATLNFWIVLLFASLAAVSAIVEGRAKKNAVTLSNQVSGDSRGWIYYSKLFEDFSYGKELRANAMGKWLLSKEREYFTRVNRNLKKQNDGFIWSGVIGAVFTFIQQCAAYGYLIYSVIGENLSIGSFTMYVTAVTAFAASLRSVMEGLAEIRAYDMYYDNLDQYLSIPANLRKSGRLPLPEGGHKIEFRNVSFRYGSHGREVLHQINLTLSQGEKLSIVGENGAGKTTFIKLLTRLYDPTEGEILLDGVNVREIDYDSYMSLFSTVFQDFKLFSFSLADNISLSLPQDPVKIEAALRKVGFSSKLDRLPKGLQTAVYKNFEEDGFEPSGGEGQKIALARALYKNAPIVVLDEPTAALDPRAEFEMYRHFHELTEGKTAVYISHRLSSAKFCDHIAVFEQGRITEYGTHEQLMDRKGTYAELFEMQAQYYV